MFRKMGLVWEIFQQTTEWLIRHSQANISLKASTHSYSLFEVQ